jgi:hypothetical protein
VRGVATFSRPTGKLCRLPYDSGDGAMIKQSIRGAVRFPRDAQFPDQLVDADILQIFEDTLCPS